MCLGVELALLNFIIFHKNSFTPLTWDPCKTQRRMNLSLANNPEPRPDNSLDSHPD